VRTIKLTIAFDGTGYAGWQRQKGAPTIQEAVEKALATMTGRFTPVHGAGRTDAGVHALGMVAHFRTESKIPSKGFHRGLNSLLPGEIRVLAAEEVEEGFHARKDARGKVYRYQMATGTMLLPTDRLYWGWFPGPLDLDAMNQAASLLVGEHDFSSFEASGSRVAKDGGRGAVRRVFTAGFRVLATAPEKIQFVIAGDGFLRHMVRNIVGTLVEVGRNQRRVEEIPELLRRCDRRFAGPTAPPQGLFLVEVWYGNEDDNQRRRVDHGTIRA